MINYYKILDLNNFSSIDKIKSSYRKLAMKHHPDRWWNSEKFKEINKAYEAFKDITLKESYDFKLKNYIEELNKPKQSSSQNVEHEEVKERYNEDKNNHSSQAEKCKNESQINNNKNHYYTNDDFVDDEEDDYEYEDENWISIFDIFSFIFKKIWQLIKYIFSLLKFIFSKDFIVFLRESINFRGKISRISFFKRIVGWFVTLFYLIQFLAPIDNYLPRLFSYLLFILLMLCYLVYFLSSILKRYNDVELKKWYLLLFLIPYINFIMIWILIFKKWKNKS